MELNSTGISLVVSEDYHCLDFDAIEFGRSYRCVEEHTPSVEALWSSEMSVNFLQSYIPLHPRRQ